MAYDASDYRGQTIEGDETERREAEYEAELAYDARLANADAALCSYLAAHEGGALYEAEMAESALELSEELGIAQPIMSAVNGWLDAMTNRKAA